MWAELGLPTRLLQQPMTSLSGGEASRVSLAALMLSRFDVLLLDEPTNDLDLDSLDRLEHFVNGAQSAVALVSHDREFLRRVVTDVAELDEFSHQLTLYAGGYDAYLRERDLARQHAWQAWEEYDTKRSTLAQRSQREREWASQGLSRAKKRPDDNDKNIKAFKINQTEQLAGRAARTDRAMERLDVVEQPREPWDLRMTIATAPRSGTLVASLTDAVVDRGPFRLGPVSVEVSFGERVVIIGPNGSGKSTLLDALLGDIALTAGIQRLGASVKLGRLEQARTQLANSPGGGKRTTLAAFQTATGLTVSEARTVAGQVRRRCRTRPSADRIVVAGRAYAFGVRHVHCRRLQLPGARRTHQPPRPAGHRADRASRRHLPRNRVAGQPRPRVAAARPTHSHHRAPRRSSGGGSFRVAADRRFRSPGLAVHL